MEVIIICNNTESGFSSYVILVFISVVSIFVISIFDSVTANIKLTKNIIAQKKAYYSADAGIAYGQFIINDNQGIPKRISKEKNYNIGKVFINKKLSEDNSFELIFDKGNNKDDIVIRVTGNYKNNKCVIKAIVDNQGKIKKYILLR